MRLFSWYLIGCLAFFTTCLQAQPTTDTLETGRSVLVKMKNGDEFTGELLSQDRQVIVLQTVNGEIRLVTTQVAYVEPYTYTGKFSFPNTNYTRYFFGPTAIPLQRKKGYYQNILVVANFVNYGVSDNFAIGGGFEFLSLVLRSPIWFLTPKFGYEVGNNVYIGGGLLMAGLAAEGVATLWYGVATVGHTETNASLGIGYGLVGGALSSRPTVMISGARRVSNSISILSENYLLPGYEGAMNYFGIQGIRILSRKNAFDLGIVLASDGEIPLPFVGYVRAF